MFRAYQESKSLSLTNKPIPYKDPGIHCSATVTGRVRIELNGDESGRATYVRRVI